MQVLSSHFNPLKVTTSAMKIGDESRMADVYDDGRQARALVNQHPGNIRRDALLHFHRSHPLLNPTSSKSKIKGSQYTLVVNSVCNLFFLPKRIYSRILGEMVGPGRFAAPCVHS